MYEVVIEQTEIVTSFEVAEHIPKKSANAFIELLTSHNPKVIFFGAATANQDLGRNPSHVNENTFAYWIGKFDNNGYIVDWAKTAKLKHSLVSDQDFKNNMKHAWWYPKNMLVFVPSSNQISVNKEVGKGKVNMLSERYLGLTGDDIFGKMWRRDWSEFGRLHHNHVEQFEITANIEEDGEDRLYEERMKKYDESLKADKEKIQYGGAGEYEDPNEYGDEEDGDDGFDDDYEDGEPSVGG